MARQNNGGNNEFGGRTAVETDFNLLKDTEETSTLTKELDASVYRSQETDDTGDTGIDVDTDAGADVSWNILGNYR